MSKARILCLHRQKSAVGYYRTRVRARMLERLGYDVTYWEDGTYTQNLRPQKKAQNPVNQWFLENLGRFDLLMVDRALFHREWGLFAGYRHHSEDCRMLVDFDDDFTAVPRWNAQYKKYQPGQEFHEAGLHHLRMSEMVTVSTPTLAEKYRPKSHCLRVIPNRIEMLDWEPWGVDPHRKDDPNLRILYGGASGHYGDLDVAREGITAMVEAQPVPWRLICFGAIPSWVYELQKEYPGRIIKLPWVAFDGYAEAVAWGGFDGAIAPLKEHPFNRAKSNIKWLEAAAQGIPLMVSDVGPYADIPDDCVVRVPNTAAQWAGGLKKLLEDKSLRKSLAEESTKQVKENWTVDSGQEELQITIEEALARPRITSLEDTHLPGDPDAQFEEQP